MSYLSFWRDSRDWREQNHENKADKCFRLVRFMDDEISIVHTFLKHSA